MHSVAKHVLVFTVAVSAECCQARSVPARERPPAFTRNTKNTMNTMNTMFFRGWRSMSHAVVHRVMHGRGATHTMASGTLLHIQNLRSLRSLRSSPFLSGREPAVFSRRTSVAWRTRALTDGGYQFRVSPSTLRTGARKTTRL